MPKTRIPIFIITVCSIFSCSSNNQEFVTKLIYIKAHGISYDKSMKPQFAVLQYLEYPRNKPLKVATGTKIEFQNGHFLNENAPCMGLTHFYSRPLPASYDFTLLIDTIFCKRFDSLYCLSKTEGRSFNYFIYENSNGIKHKILFYDNQLPPILNKIYEIINNIYSSNHLYLVPQFRPDTLLFQIQEEVFQHFPPPPPPDPKIFIKWE